MYIVYQPRYVSTFLYYVGIVASVGSGQSHLGWTANVCRYGLCRSIRYTDGSCMTASVTIIHANTLKHRPPRELLNGCLYENMQRLPARKLMRPFKPIALSGIEPNSLDSSPVTGASELPTVLGALHEQNPIRMANTCL